MKKKVNFNFIFIHIKKSILEIFYFFGENPGTNQNFIAHVTVRCYNVKLIKLYSTMITFQHVHSEIHDEVRKNDKEHNKMK